jgi:hypothetical protein
MFNGCRCEGLHYTMVARRVRGAKPRAKKKIVKCPVIMEHF